MPACARKLMPAFGKNRFEKSSQFPDLHLRPKLLTVPNVQNGNKRRMPPIGSIALGCADHH